jgi:PAS domain-containing protein
MKSFPDPGSGMRRYALCGRVIDQGAQGHLAVLWLRDDTIAATETAAAIRIGDGFRKSLGSFPFPVWRRRRELTFDYVNPAYLDVVEAEPEARLDDAPELSAGATGNSGRALASRAAETANPQTEAHHIVAAGARRLMDLTEAPVGGDGAIGGFAIDRTEVEEIKTELARHIENHEQACIIWGRQLRSTAPIAGSNFSTPPM